MILEDYRDWKDCSGSTDKFGMLVVCDQSFIFIKLQHFITTLTLTFKTRQVENAKGQPREITNIGQMYLKKSDNWQIYLCRTRE